MGNEESVNPFKEITNLWKNTYNINKYYQHYQIITVVITFLTTEPVEESHKMHLFVKEIEDGISCN